MQNPDKHWSAQSVPRFMSHTETARDGELTYGTEGPSSQLARAWERLPGILAETVPTLISALPPMVGTDWRGIRTFTTLARTRGMDRARRRTYSFGGLAQPRTMVPARSSSQPSGNAALWTRPHLVSRNQRQGRTLSLQRIDGVGLCTCPVKVCW